MKKIIRGVLLGILALIIIGGAVGAYFLFGGKKPEISPQPYIVDNEGTSYLAVVDEEGVTYAAVTDNVGNIYAAEVDENGNIGETKGQINDQVDVAKLPTNYTGEHIEETADVNAFTGNAQVVEEPATQAPGTTEVSAPNTPTTQSSGNNNTATTKASGGNNGTQTTASGGNSGAGTTAAQAPQKKTYRISKYQDMFASGQYLMEFKTSDPELGDTPITFATKNGNIMIDSTIQNLKCKMLYLSNEDKTYILIDNMKKYSELPAEMMGDEGIDMSEMTKGFARELDGELTTSTVKIGDKTLNCETRTDPDNTQTRYLFDGDTLVRIDEVASDGTVSSTYISRLTSDVPDSTFEIPKNYGYLNLKWLADMAG